MEPNNLNAAERKLWEAFPRRELVDLSDAADPTVSAQVIRSLPLGARAASPGHLAALTLVDAHIVNTLDLSFSEIAYPVRMSRCHFERGIEMLGARTREFDLAGRASRASWHPKP